MPVRLGLCVLLTLLAGPALGAERFYQVIGPDGRVQTLVAPGEDKRESDTSSPQRPKKGFGDWLRPGKSKRAEPLSEAPPAPSDPPAGWAPYDSDEYLDSEVLEATDFNPEKKRSFYIINDGVRVRVEEELAPASADSISAPATKQPSPRTPSFPLPDEYQEVNWDAVSGLVDGKCLPEKAMATSRVLREGELAGVLMDKQALAFVRPGQVLESFSLGEERGGSLIVRSYASTERKPEFGRPLIALADDRGCLHRVLTGYFQVRYEATKTRYSMLEAELKLAPDESRIFVIVPRQSSLSVNTGYTLSRYGKLGIKWHR